MIIEIFKTNVSEQGAADNLVALLLRHFPDSRITFDLEDCDRVLRIAGPDCCPATTISLLGERGFCCSVLK